MDGIGKLFYAAGVGGLAEEEAFAEQSMKLAQAQLYRSKTDEAIAKASLDRDREAARARLRDRAAYMRRTTSDPISAPQFDKQRWRDDVLEAWSQDANDYASAGQTFLGTDLQDEAGGLIRGGNLSLGNQMLIAAQGKPVELTKVAGDVAFNPYLPDATTVATPVGQSQIDLRGAQVGTERATQGKLGAEMARIQAETARGGTTPAIQNWQFAQNLPPEQQDRFFATSGGRGNTVGKPLPASLQKEEDSDISDIQLSTAIAADLEKFAAQAEKGDLKLGPVANLVSEGQNWAGHSTPNSLNFASFRAGLEKLRNDSLRLNKGVQTEGDAKRAWDEILASINDAPLVAKRLREVQVLNQRAADLKDQLIQNRRNSYGLDPLDTGHFRVKVNSGGASAGWDDDYAEGEILTNPQTGERVQLQAGQWVPL